MSAQIIAFPCVKKSDVVLDELVDGLLTDLMPRLLPENEARDQLDERFHQFLIKTGIIPKTNR